MVSRMRPMVCERKTRSASGTAESRDAPRSMAPTASASAMAAGELTPVIAPSNPAWRRASPKDEPIRPVPTMTTFCMLVPCTERDRVDKPRQAPGAGNRGQTGLPADFRQKAPEIHGSLVSPRRYHIVLPTADPKGGGEGKRGQR